MGLLLRRFIAFCGRRSASAYTILLISLDESVTEPRRVDSKVTSLQLREPSTSDIEVGIHNSKVIMGQFFDSCPETLFTWIRNQHIFFVATGPLSPSGHVNVSPKGAFDCFHLVGPNKIWYEDLTGSGNETIAHLRENGRITVMFVAFDGLPRIVRFFGTGETSVV